MKKILVTGAAGFIGYSLIKSLPSNFLIIGIDNLNKYYDVKLKQDRVKNLKQKKNFIFLKIDLNDKKKIIKLFKKYKFEYVVNLAAQAGVRYSVKNPDQYLKSNIIGFFNILKISCEFSVKHFIYASSSSVYGDSDTFPSYEYNQTDSPLSFYAASKKSNEIIAFSFSNIYKIACTGLRFFTVYGPYGRPDMSPMIFASKILKNKKLELYENGNLYRDFTYIDYTVSYIKKIINKPPYSKIPHRILNIGNKKPVKVLNFLREIENYLENKANIVNKPLPVGDVKKTYADVSKINKIVSIPPKSINYKIGIKKFLDWYTKYYNCK